MADLGADMNGVGRGTVQDHIAVDLVGGGQQQMIASSGAAAA